MEVRSDTVLCWMASGAAGLRCQAELQTWGGFFAEAQLVSGMISGSVPVIPISYGLSS